MQGKLTDVLLREKLAAPLAVAAIDAEHPAADTLVACASNELSPGQALAVTRHLATCPDGRCPALFAATVAGLSAAHDALHGGRRTERSDTALHTLHTRTPRSFRCDDALWSAFEQMAHEQGRPLDALLNEAMAAYTPAPQPAPSVRPLSGEPRLAVIHEGVLYEVTKPRFVVGRRAPVSDLTIDDPAVSRQHALVERAAGHYYLIDMGSTNGVEFRGERILRKEISNGDRFRICDHELIFVIH